MCIRDSAKAFVLAHPEVVIDEKLVAAQDVEKEVEKFREAVAKTCLLYTSRCV